MENREQNEILETKKSPLHTITPLSKYLAMILFVLLPFVGGWIGYVYSPEKIVESEKVSEMKNTDFKPFLEIDKVFTTYDIDYNIYDSVLIDDTLFWSHRSTERRGEIHILQPRKLEYVGLGLLTDGEKVYSMNYNNSIDLSVLNATNDFEMITEGDVVLLANGKNLFSFDRYQTIYPILLTEPLTFNDLESLKVIGSGYFEVDDKIYLNSAFGEIIELTEADPDTFKILGVGFSSDKNSVFYGGQKLTGVDPTTVSFETQRGMRIMIANDRVWAPKGCTPQWYEEIPLSELTGYSNC